MTYRAVDIDNPVWRTETRCSRCKKEIPGRITDYECCPLCGAVPKAGLIDHYHVPYYLDEEGGKVYRHEAEVEGGSTRSSSWFSRAAAEGLARAEMNRRMAPSRVFDSVMVIACAFLGLVVLSWVVVSGQLAWLVFATGVAVTLLVVLVKAIVTLSTAWGDWER